MFVFVAGEGCILQHSILFSHKKCKNLEKLDIRRGDIKIKQHSKVKYLGCLLDENLSGESVATKMLGKNKWQAKISLQEAKLP